MQEWDKGKENQLHRMGKILIIKNMFDLYRKNERIVFQLYAACSGYDFTSQQSGIKKIGYQTFISITNKVTGPLSVHILATSIWEELHDKTTAAGFANVTDI